MQCVDLGGRRIIKKVGFMTPEAMAASQARLQAQRMMRNRGLDLDEMQADADAMDVGNFLYGDGAPLMKRHATALQDKEKSKLKSTLRLAPPAPAPVASGRRGSIEPASTMMV
eukprot:3791934-Rhodomonas_salina.1